ncbi:hypothetical protein ACP46_gp06 [Rhizobium phage RHEph06]|uniref:Uncharacterized protein n=2 Tax=Kleczkowskavirus RHEph4 TaxID=1921526 RepID=L7TR97_9CAUD|nr:hypothetical protein ACP46_gp06 [Rhizobium phage RHEph06]YP_009598447.1 hypothetical protein FDH25_gp05 [Rhizobium phage RHEph04]AGC35691.1 hypothetical protein RHEph04_gp005 [Rhizobium phage RHEph04]AGC35848.1 hypothetical protein RHEph06_gp006 [Rhizobium phage RHEph06]QXV74883.1 hypothetical protein [Rhizobium phage RHEph26]
MLDIGRHLLAFVSYIDRHPIHQAHWVRNGCPAVDGPLETCEAFQICSDAGALLIARDDWLQVRKALTGTGIEGRSLFRVTSEGQELLERSREG